MEHQPFPMDRRGSQPAVKGRAQTSPLLQPHLLPSRKVPTISVPKIWWGFLGKGDMQRKGTTKSKHYKDSLCINRSSFTTVS